MLARAFVVVGILILEAVGNLSSKDLKEILNVKKGP